MGRSPFHVGNITLVINSFTQRVSDQYHVVFDDSFITVASEHTAPPYNWTYLISSHTERVDLGES